MSSRYIIINIGRAPELAAALFHPPRALRGLNSSINDVILVIWWFSIVAWGYYPKFSAHMRQTHCDRRRRFILHWHGWGGGTTQIWQAEDKAPQQCGITEVKLKFSLILTLLHPRGGLLGRLLLLFLSFG